MNTIIRVHLGADFSANNIGTIDYEAPIDLPADDLILAYRTRLSLAECSDLLGTSPALIEQGTGTTYDGISATAAPSTGNLALSGYPIPSGAVTMMAVFKQVASSPSNTSPIFGSYHGGAQPRCSIYETNAGVLTLRRNDDTVAMAKSGGDRWEMLVAVCDPGVAFKLVRPRTDTESTGSSAATNASADSVRIWGNNTRAPAGRGYQGALFAAWNKALSDEEISDMYLSAKSSLAVSGIGI